MITEKEYLTALQIVTEYEKQLNLQIVRHCGGELDYTISNQNIGDFIVFASVKGTAKGGFTLNKAYRILDKIVNGNYIDLEIKNDKGQRWKVSSRNYYKRWSCA